MRGRGTTAVEGRPALRRVAALVEEELLGLRASALFATRRCCRSDARLPRASPRDRNRGEKAAVNEVSDGNYNIISIYYMITCHACQIRPIHTEM